MIAITQNFQRVPQKLNSPQFFKMKIGATHLNAHCEIITYLNGDIARIEVVYFQEL